MRKCIWIVSVFLFVLLMVNQVSAQYTSSPYDLAENLVDSVENFFGPIFGALLGDRYEDGLLFAKVLYLFLLFFIIQFALIRVPPFKDERKIAGIVALIVSILAVRYVSESALILGVLLPYSALGVAIMTIIPFLIYFYFVHSMMSAGVARRLAWILYMIVLLGMWISTVGELNIISNYIYAFVFLAALIVFFFDKKVRQYFALAEIEKAKSNIDAENVAEAYKKYADFMRMYRDTGDQKFLKRAKHYEKYLREAGVKSL
ncbi:hypothetical protein COU60_01840 [Candidatus Pacearchaeota archaeon CG10_big_fil_rev_8_21_14_0_10_34_76]|nr:MAG: hypothetical protein COU60_01840 [Candidatus Pacearchaeota archaeon CG10_big_fil_rev_8_21_14_0_10_34_76]